MVEFAVNYSFAAVDLLGQGQIQIDRFKLAAQIPRLYTLVKDGQSVVQWNEPF